MHGSHEFVVPQSGNTSLGANCHRFLVDLERLHDTADALAAAAGLFADVDMVGRKALPMASVQLGICHLDMTRIALGIEQGRYEPISIELGPFEFRLGAVVLGRIGSCGVRIGSASIDLPDHFTVLSNRAAKSAPAPIKIKGAMSAFGP